MSPARPNLHLHPFVKHVASALRHRCGVTQGACIVVGVSGGADSVALLRSLHLLADRRTWHLHLVVGHVQHHLRDDAEDDARFVEGLAATLGLPFARRDIHPRHQGGNIESTARQQRYAALVQVAAEHSATCIATAHHADDQLETMLMRLLRGTSITGLRGIAWRRSASVIDQPASIAIIRPMLAVSRADALGFLDRLQQSWREDHTNADTTRLRARLRQEVLPLLRAIRPDAARNAVTLAADARAMAAILESQVNAAMTCVTDAPNPCINRQAVRQLPRLVFAALLRRLLARCGADLDRVSRHSLDRAVDAVYDRIDQTRRFAFGYVDVTVGRTVVTIAGPNPLQVQ